LDYSFTQGEDTVLAAMAHRCPDITSVTTNITIQKNGREGVLSFFQSKEREFGKQKV